MCLSVPVSAPYHPDTVVRAYKRFILIEKKLHALFMGKVSYPRGVWHAAQERRIDAAEMLWNRCNDTTGTYLDEFPSKLSGLSYTSGFHAYAVPPAVCPYTSAGSVVTLPVDLRNVHTQEEDGSVLVAREMMIHEDAEPLLIPKLGAIPDTGKGAMKCPDQNPNMPPATPEPDPNLPDPP